MNEVELALELYEEAMSDIALAEDEETRLSAALHALEVADMIETLAS